MSDAPQALLPLDPQPLERFLAANLPGYAGGLRIEQFVGGQSNPTYRLHTHGASYVLRKKPPGELLPSAHAVDREYRLMKALAAHDVPVPGMLLYSDDQSVVGTPFFVMTHVEGRVFRDPMMPELAPANRRPMIVDLMDALARLHAVDYQAAGLSDYGRPGNYYARQVARWSKQYRASETHVIEAMDKLIAWLPDHIPADDRTTLVHGDYRIENAIVHPTLPKVAALVDWELSTLGHPMADLAHFCMMYHLPRRAFGGYRDSDIAALAIPSEAEAIAAYAKRSGPVALADWPFYMAFALFRMTAILQGVYARALAGNASSPDGKERGARATDCAHHGWAIAQGG